MRKDTLSCVLVSHTSQDLIFHKAFTESLLDIHLSMSKIVLMKPRKDLDDLVFATYRKYCIQ